MADFDLVIVGAGPAGMAAVTMVSGRGLRVAVIDEQLRPGGQILRQPPAPFRVEGWLNGRAYRPLKAALRDFAAITDVEWLGGRSVIGLERKTSGGFRLTIAGPAGVERHDTERVLVATGCYDLPMAGPGWTLPGAMAAGGMQAFLKSQQLLPSEPLVLAGTHPLMLLIAEQVVVAGGTVSTVAFQQSLATMIRALWRAPATVLRNAPLLAGVLAGIAALRRRGVRVRFGLPLSAIEGGDAVSAARFARPGGEAETIACAAIGLCYGFLPQSDLLRLIGASTLWAGPAGGWAARHDAWMRSSVPGLYVAGEAVGVGGAASALPEGRLAALAILLDSGLLDEGEADARARPFRKEQRRRRGFARLLADIADPTEAFAQPLAPDTLLCRCEDVPVARIDAAIETGASANGIKLVTRVGMGLCQGRSCEHALLRRIALRRGTSVETMAGFAVRFPIRPTRIGDLASAMSVARGATNSVQARD